VEIYWAILPRLNPEALSADALIADFEAHQWLAAFLACSACSGDYEDPDRTAPVEILDEAQNSDRHEVVEKSHADGIPGSRNGAGD
jgi:hypothetical protein